MSDLILTASLLVHSAGAPPQIGWGVVVRDARIADVGPLPALQKRYPHAQTLRFPDQAITPAFVNTHHHMYGVLSHGIPLDAAPAGFWPFLADFWWPRVEDALTHAMIAATTDLACMEMVRSGVTTFYDCLEAPNALPGALDIEAEIVRRWGLRGYLSFEATQRQSEANGLLGLQENAGFIDRCRVAGGLVQGLMCYHTTFTCSEEFIRRAFALAGERSVKVHAHLSEGTYEPDYCLRQYGRRTVAQYAHWGLLGPQMLASQCVQIDAHEVALLAEHNVAVSHMPLSNCEVGGGFSPVPEMLDAGVSVSLGSDGYINDFFEVMRGAFLMHKARRQDPGVMPAATVWKMATEHGAAALGLPDVGRLAAGCAADLLTIDLDLPTPATAGNLRDQLLLWANPEKIRNVMAAGRFLMRDGVIGVDEPAIRARARQAALALWSRAG
jgi:cytosine/adenosine deaminase-related metal-dependent hydrolase